jgi:hypothetical protein
MLTQSPRARNYTIGHIACAPVNMPPSTMTTMDDDIFARWQGFYRDDTTNTRATLTIHVHNGYIILTTTSGERLRHTTLEVGLLLDALAAAIRSAGPIPTPTQ